MVHPEQEIELDGNLAIVTGGASGLGADTVAALAAHGARVAIFDRNRADGEAIADKVSGHFYRVDVANEDEVSAALALCSRNIGPPRILVNCAGIARNFELLDDNRVPHPLQDFIDLINVNLIGTFNCMRLFAEQAATAAPLIENERGVVINVGSISGSDCPSNQIAYGASKAAVMGMTLGAARSLGRWGIRVVTISPGLFRTPMLSASDLDVEAMDKAMARVTPFPSRMGEPSEFAELVTAICRLRYLNGEVIRLDGAMRPSFAGSKK